MIRCLLLFLVLLLAGCGANKYDASLDIATFVADQKSVALSLDFRDCASTLQKQIQSGCLLKQKRRELEGLALVKESSKKILDSKASKRCKAVVIAASFDFQKLYDAVALQGRALASNDQAAYKSASKAYAASAKMIPAYDDLSADEFALVCDLPVSV